MEKINALNDLIAYLTKENLLDSGTKLVPVKRTREESAGLSVEGDPPKSPEIDLLLNSETCEVNLSGLNLFRPEDPNGDRKLTFKDIRSVQDLPKAPSELQVPGKKKTRRKRYTIEPKRGRCCPNCEIVIYSLSIHCQRCGERVVSDLYYYSLIILALLGFTIMVWFVVTSKTYN